MKTLLILFQIILFFFSSLSAQQTEILFLSGEDADAPVDWEFMVSNGMNANKWTTISVPSNWELKGFGNYNYGLDKNKSNEIGYYKYEFNVLKEWEGRQINIVFEGVMTDTYVKINGKSAGNIHQGGFYRFEYNITNLLNYGKENLLEVTVQKVSSNKSIELAERRGDYWVFGGIYRPVYLKIMPREHIVRTAIDAKANGNFIIDVYYNNIKTANKIEIEILENNGNQLGNTISKEINVTSKAVKLFSKVKGQKNWTSETPNLYYVDISLKKDDKLIHKIRERFGFRTFEVRKGKSLYLNDIRIILKGINRHTFEPSLGRAFSRKQCLDDIKLIKQMNMNAVRMSHYPPDTYFLDLCDEYGLYVLDEIAGWQKPSYDTPTSKRLIKETVIRDVNHPSILFWDNGNEGGWNLETDNEFAKYDPQKRTVLHPWELFNGIDTDHYEDYESVKNKLKSGNIFMPTEHLHGLYDGGLGAGLDDFWKLMWGNPLNGGMFLWNFADEGVIRTDKNRSIDSDGNHAPDGILGPFREKEASFFTIKEIWSPIYIETDNVCSENFNGIIAVENRYNFSNLKECSFKWKIVKYSDPKENINSNKEISSGFIQGPNIPPRKKGIIELDIPFKYNNADALFLTAYDNYDREINTWKWKFVKNHEIVRGIIDTTCSAPALLDNGSFINVNAENFKFSFNKANGMLDKVEKLSKPIHFNSGPVFVSNSKKKEIKKDNIKINFTKTENAQILNIIGHPDFNELRWTIYGNGWLKLDYTYILYDSVDYMGISFNYPENKIFSKKWLGKGPYRVWKNRLKGQTVDVWENEYKNFRAGTKWDYPEFVGYFADFSWLVLTTKDGFITILTENEDLFLRLFSQEDGKEPRKTKMIWPKGDISFLHAIPAIGTKFQKTEVLGPQSKTNVANGAYSGTLYFYFGLPN